jgi:hypothetical protein
MTRKPSRVGVLALLLAAALGSAPAPAALPGLNEQPWYGRFFAYQNKKFRFGLDGHAAAILTPMGRAGNPINRDLALPVTFVVEEVLPNGRTITKKILPDTLTTEDAATAKPGKVSFRGTVTGGAKFAGHLEVEHGVVAIGGRLLDPGTLTKNPLRFGVRVAFPSAYRDEPHTDKRAVRAFENLLKDDRLAIVRTDDKHMKINGNDKIGTDSKIINGSGIAALKIEIAAYQGKVIEFSASPHSRMELWNRRDQPLHDGFTINWYPDPATDPAGTARLRFEVK